jgi:glycosyltransferase involved in cell wall biosynthesis
MSYVLCPMSYVLCPMSYVLSFMTHTMYRVPYTLNRRVSKKMYLCFYSNFFLRRMEDFVLIRKRFDDLGCCIIIPTYNNSSTLEKVITGAGKYTGSVIIVNDGCTDDSPEILKKYPQYTVLDIPKNTGKGWALRQGFRYALEKGFRYAITIDSDGQHDPEDLVRFIDKIEEEPDSVIIGARNMDQHSVPGTSSFGHKFSIFWFRVETGLKVPDIQSGYRLYPLEKVRGMRFLGRKYEFEVEVLVKLAWRDVSIHSVPVSVFYAPKGERVSHFRKVRDFTRVSIANVLLVFTALLWINPFRFIKALRKTSVKKFIRDYVINSSDSNMKISLSVAAGCFIGVIPVWGFQMLLAFSAAYLLKLNKFVTVAASNISIPPMLPLILILSYFTGGIITGRAGRPPSPSGGFSIRWFESNLVQYLIGSLVFGILLGLVLGTVTWLLLKIFRKPAMVAGANDTHQQI